MPGGDGTGPEGKGPRTGGGFGFCPPTDSAQPITQPSQTTTIPLIHGRGFGPCGRGLARGYRGGRGCGLGGGR